MVVVAEIIDDTNQEEKFFHGGWRNTVTGISYYNAFTQTYVDGKDVKNKCNRSVQTADPVNVSTCTYRDKSIRTSYVPDLEDRFILVRRIFNAATTTTTSTSTRTTKPIGSDNLSAERAAAIKIQRFYRNYRARRVTSSATEKNVIRERNDFGDEDSRRRRPFEGMDLERWLTDGKKPETKSDFDRLYEALKEWRISEIERATGNSELFRSSRIAVCSHVLSREVELIRKIEAMRSAAKLKFKERRRRNLLEELSRPALWRINQGESISSVDTPIVQRSRQFLNRYEMLRCTTNSKRIVLLRDIKKLAEPHTCVPSDELIYLVNQEIDLLSLGIDVSKLNSLRDRVAIAYLSFANDSLKGHRKSFITNGNVTDRNANGFCKSCGRILSPMKYHRRLSRSRTFLSSCVYCDGFYSLGTPRIVYEPYRRMLREVRRLETGNRCHTGIAFVIPPEVVYRLVNGIWHGKSAISECDQLDRLCLLRFRNDVEWSPWNTLLLTKEEALEHRRIRYLRDFYDGELLRKFHMKNFQARLAFRYLLDKKYRTLDSSHSRRVIM